MKILPQGHETKGKTEIFCPGKLERNFKGSCSLKYFIPILRMCICARSEKASTFQRQTGFHYLLISNSHTHPLPADLIVLSRSQHPFCKTVSALACPTNVRNLMSFTFPVGKGLTFSECNRMGLRETHHCQWFKQQWCLPIPSYLQSALIRNLQTASLRT